MHIFQQLAHSAATLGLALHPSSVGILGARTHGSGALPLASTFVKALTLHSRVNLLKFRLGTAEINIE